MPINFPSNPSVDQTYTSSGTTWKYTGSAWKVEPADPGYATVAVSGSYNDLINKPTAFSALTALQFTAGVSVNEFSNDSTMADASATAVPTEAATKTYVDTAITNLIGAAPEVLNTLDELANAINDDSSFASSVTVALSEKAPIASPTFTGTVSGITAAMVGLGNVTNESKATMFTSPTFTTSIDGSNTMTAFASSSTLTIGFSGTASSSQTDISTAAVTGFNIKTINIGTGATGLASTAINIGAAANTTTTINGIVNVGTIRYSTKTGDLTVTGPYTLDCALYDNWAFTVTGATSLSFSNSPASGRRYTATLIITQAAGGGGSISAFPSGTVWPGGVAPTLTATASRTDIFTLTTVDGGTKWFGSVIGQNWA